MSTVYTTYSKTYIKLTTNKTATTKYVNTGGI